MANARRKISNTNRGDLEVGLNPLIAKNPPEQPFSSMAHTKGRTLVNRAKTMASTTASKAKQMTSTLNAGNDRDLFGKIIKVAIVLVVLLDLYWYVTPRDKRFDHMKSLNEQMSKFAFSVREKKEELDEEIEEVTEEIEEEKKSLADYLPIVGKGHHEEELNLLREEHNLQVGALKDDHQKQIDSLKGEHEKAFAELKAEYEKLSKEKQAAVDRLQNAIKNDENKLEDLKEEEAILEEDTDISNFCPECAFNHAGLSTKCGKRRDYLVSHYGNTPENAVKAVISWDSNCKKN